MGIKFRGEKYDNLDFDKITPGEVGALEKQLQMEFPVIQFALKSCVCGHQRDAHLHKDDNAELTDDTSCTKCELCSDFSAKIPSSFSTALVWMAVKRRIPTVTYKEIADTPYDELADDEAEEPANPT
jgi:hypothetical protein